MAQGSRLTEEQIARVSESLEVNPHWRAAAAHAGIHEDTIHLYRRLAENYTNRHKEDQDFQDETDPDWWQWNAVQQWIAARDRLEMQCAKSLLEHGEKDWRAHYTILKALAPQDWSDRVELTGAGGGPVEFSTDEVRAQIEASLDAIAAKREAAGQGSESADAPRAGDDPQA